MERKATCCFTDQGEYCFANYRCDPVPGPCPPCYYLSQTPKIYYFEVLPGGPHAVAGKGACGIRRKPAAAHVRRNRVTPGLICCFQATRDQVADLLKAQAAYNCAFIRSGSIAILVGATHHRQEQIAVGEGRRNKKREQKEKRPRQKAHRG